MMTSIQSPSLLEKYSSSEFTQRLFRSDQSVATAATTDFGHLLTNVDRSATTPTPPAETLFADLNAARTQQFGTTYGATGAAERSTANTVLIGYG